MAPLGKNKRRKNNSVEDQKKDMLNTLEELEVVKEEIREPMRSSGIQEESVPVQTVTEPKSDGFSLKHPEKEIRSKRVQFVMTPSLYKKLQAAKKKQKLSVNEILTQIVEDRIDMLI